MTTKTTHRLKTWFRTREAARLAAARQELTPRLQRWMGEPDGTSLTRLEVLAWVTYQRLGVTDEIAQRWSERGYGPGIAAAALVDLATVDQVDELAKIFWDAGAWDGHDRLALTDLIGWHLDVDGDIGHPYPVLGRWLALPPTLVYERVRETVDRAHRGHLSVDSVTQFTADPAVQAAAAVLEQLESGHRPGGG